MSSEILDALKGEENPEPKEEPKPEPKVDPRDEKIDRLETALLGNQNMISQLSGKLDTMTTMLTDKNKEPEAEYEDDDDLTAKQALEIARRERKEERKEDGLSVKQAKWDNKTDKDFGPFGFVDKSSKFYRETVAEYNSNGDKNSATAVYDSASRVFARGMREGWIKPNALETAKKNHDIANGTLEGGMTGKRGLKVDKETTEVQQYFGKKLGFSKEKIDKIYDKEGTA